MKEGLWTKNFTIITLGSAVSMLGNAMIGFAISLFILDYTDTLVLYALAVFLYTLPQILSPILAGPLMDRFSRRRTIYLLDFVSAALYCGAGIILFFDLFSFALLAMMALLVGTINSVYLVAFNSFYPLLISEGNFSKAYSVSSTLETLSFVMIPVATFLYKSFGIAPLLLSTSVCFLLAALFETQISDVETTNLANEKNQYSAKRYVADTKEGFRYIWGEKGLRNITLYFMFNFLASGAAQVITLPWFRENFHNGEYVYMSVWGFTVLGRLFGGMLHYKHKIPAQWKFGLALLFHIAVACLEGSYLYFSLCWMRICCFAIGIFAITSYNIRVSATQSYVPNEKKGRFNGVFLMMSTVGSLSGELLAGVLVSVLPVRVSLSVFMGISLLAAIILLGGGRKHIAPLYNRDS